MVQIKLRTLIIDDDATMLGRLQERLRGMHATTGRRTVKPEIDSLLVSVEFKDNRFDFTEQTLQSLLDKCSKRYDYMILDYAYASPERQVAQWNEGRGKPKKHASNDHLLTVTQLKDQLVAYDATRGGSNRKRIERFFNQPARIMLRSFQHNRQNDILGPYSSRVEATKGVFPHNSGVDELDGFSLIYGSEPELRETFYHQANDGRRLYRYAATALMVRFYQVALEHHLATKTNRLVLSRGAFSISAFVVLVAALSSVVQSLVGPLVAEVAAGQWVSAIALALVTVLGLFGGSLGVAWLAERGARRLISEGDSESS